MMIAEQAKRLQKGTEQVVPDNGLVQKLALAQKEKRPLIVKLGLDPTAPDIHLGHSVVLRKLRQFQDFDHKVVLIVGDFTAKIGDPSGKSHTRPVLTDEEIKVHAKTYERQAKKILRTDKAHLEIRFNHTWLAKITFAQLLQQLGKVTVAQILDRDDFKKRMDAGTAIGLHELLYPVMQGYDSLAINADVELGGTDQTFNLLMGRQLQAASKVPEQVVMTMPLIAGTDGKQKMSKSLGNYIGITDAPQEMFGKVMSLPDNLMEQYATLCTDLDWAEYREQKPIDAKKALARAIVTIYHGERKAKKAEESFTATFQKGDFPADAQKLVVKNGSTLLSIFIETKVLSSNSEARRKIVEGAVALDGEKITDPLRIVAIPEGKEIQLKVGKRGFYLLLSK